MRLRLLGRSLIQSRSFVDTILVQCSVSCLSHLLRPSIVIFFRTVWDFFSLYEVLGRAEWIFNWCVFVLLFLTLRPVLELFDVFVDQSTVFFERKLLVIINRNANFARWLDYLVLAVKLSQKGMLKYLKHWNPFLWVEL